MKPFNLDAALRGDPVVTREGKDVKIAGYNPDAPFYQRVVGWVTGVFKGVLVDAVDGVSLGSWSESGRVYSFDDDWDLFMKPRTVEKWAVVYYEGDALFFDHDAVYDRKEEAEKNANGKPVARITWEE